MLEQSLLSWIERSVPGKGTNYESALPAIVATDIGLTRKENQDRAVVMRFASDGRTQTVFALADGMGGMRDGAHCASLGLAGFLTHFAASHDADTLTRLHSSALYANQAVHAYAQGHGGATLSAVVVNGEDGLIHSVNVGDSRSFAFNHNGVERLTVDDSLAEAVGGHGRELLQFVGMGDGMQPHVRPYPSQNANILLTSDGVHFVEKETFDTILTRAPTIRAAADRLMALARWCGGPDNATLIAAKPTDVENASAMDGTLQLWDSFSMLHIIFAKSEIALTQPSYAPPPKPQNTSLDLGETPSNQAVESVNPGTRSRKQKRARKMVVREEVQLSIDVEGSRGEGEKNADR
jgi:serine/threonine protein phosphatase PrpC